MPSNIQRDVVRTFSFVSSCIQFQIVGSIAHQQPIKSLVGQLNPSQFWMDSFFSFSSTFQKCDWRIMVRRKIISEHLRCDGQ